MGVWDAQKMKVADEIAGVIHVDLKVADVVEWYKIADGEDPDEDVALISADGIHPNREGVAANVAVIETSAIVMDDP